MSDDESRAAVVERSMSDLMRSLEPTQRAEALGRLVIWSGALHDTSELLKMALRAHESGNARLDANDQATSFPTAWEAFIIGGYLPLAAAVLFSSIYNRGWREQSRAATNGEDFMVAIRDSIESYAFPGEDDLARFTDLKMRVIRARNSMIAHADGAAFNIGFTETMVTSKTASGAVDRNDLQPWLDATGLLRNGLFEHMATIRREVT